MELVYIIHKERFVPIKYNIPDILSHVIKYLMNVLPLWGMKKNVTKEAERSRTAVSDNRATIKSTFLINTIVYDVHWLVVIWEIFDYMGHTELGNKKDATFFCYLHEKVMNGTDTENRYLICDTLMGNCFSNMQEV